MILTRVHVSHVQWWAHCRWVFVLEVHAPAVLLQVNWILCLVCFVSSIMSASEFACTPPLKPLELHNGTEIRQTDTVQDLKYQPTFILLVGNLVFAICAGVWSAGYFILGALYSAIFPLVMLVLCLLSAIHVRMTGQVMVARMNLSYCLTFAALGVHWSFGGITHSSGVAHWAMLGPQLLIISRGKTLHALCLFGITIILYTAFSVLCHPHQRK